MIENIIDARKQQLIKLEDLIKARFVEMFGDILCNDKGWPIYALDAISSSRLGKMLDAKRNTEKIHFRIWQILMFSGLNLIYLHYMKWISLTLNVKNFL